MKVTAILCTYNRCESLAKALGSLAASVLPENVDWEVLIVDNNSKDATGAVAEDFCQRYPGRFRYLFEPHQGKSYALNSGIRESRGYALAFVDDDVAVGPTWLHDLTSVLHDGKWAGSGGRILPTPGFVPPHWLAMSGPHAMGGVAFAHFDLGDEARQLDRPPYGTNMAFTKDVFKKYGDFRLDMGPCPGSEIRSEDTEFGSRLINGGEHLIYVPSAVVYHEVLEHRVRQKFFLTWWFDFGRARIREVGVRPKLFGLPRHYISLPNNIFRILPFKTLRWFLTLNPQQRFFYKCSTWATMGTIVEIWRQSIELKKSSKVQGTRDAAC